MCGIAGYINLNGAPASKDILKKMGDSIAHRGPDGEGFYCHENIGFAHRRLAIIDVRQIADQPMKTEDENYVLIYNGEIYNFHEIRHELVNLGHHFNTESDTEVLLHAYMEWGKESIHKFNGMFAFALFDKEKKELCLARDRYGIKPLYYTISGKTLIFGSEIKAILQHPSISVTLNMEGMMEYFTFQNFFTHNTLYKDISLLENGTMMIFNLEDDLKIDTIKYWEFDFSDEEKYSTEEEYIEEFDELFRASIDRHLISDVELGSYLSGGMDSGSITALSAQKFPYLKTFTAGFDMNSISGMEIRFDERNLAEYMSYLFKTEHYEMVLKSGDMERIIPELVHHLEEPRVGQSYPNFYVARLAGKFVKVVLSGTGGDELFAGYPWRYYRAMSSLNFEDYIDKYYVFWQRLIPNKSIHKVFAPVWNDVKHVWTRDLFKDVFEGMDIDNINTPEEYLNLSLYFEAKTFLHGLLMVEDKLSMASSLESRVPFLDNTLVDFAMKLPSKYKLANISEIQRLNENEDGSKMKKFYEKSNDGKMLLRKAMKQYMPKEITSGIKQGFSAPDASWFKGDSIEYVKRKLYGKDARIFDFMDRKSVHEIVDEHLSGTQNRRLFIWSLLYFEEWCKQNL